MWEKPKSVECSLFHQILREKSTQIYADDVHMYHTTVRHGITFFLEEREKQQLRFSILSYVRMCKERESLMLNAHFFALTQYTIQNYLNFKRVTHNNNNNVKKILSCSLFLFPFLHLFFTHLCFFLSFFCSLFFLLFFYVYFHANSTHSFVKPKSETITNTHVVNPNTRMNEWVCSTRAEHRTTFSFFLENCGLTLRHSSVSNIYST